MSREGDGPKGLLEFLVGAGLVAYVYVAGGVVEYLRFAGAGLPAGQALSLLSSRQLAITGVEIALVAVGLWGFSRCIHWLAQRLRHSPSNAHQPIPTEGQSPAPTAATAADAEAERQGDPQTDEEVPARSAIRTAGAGAVTAGLAAVAFEVIADATSAGGLEGLGAAVGSAGAVGAGLGLAVVPLVVAVGWRGLLDLPARFVATGFITLAFVGGAAYAYFTPLHMSRAIIRLSGGTCVQGIYLARDEEGVHLIDGEAKLLLTIPAGNVAVVQIKGSATVKDESIHRVSCNTIDAESAFASTGSDRSSSSEGGVSPVVRKLAPSAGRSAGGTIVAITGTGFTGVRVVEFGQRPAKAFEVVSSTIIEAESPAGRGKVNVAVTTGAGRSARSAKGRFTYKK